VHSGQCIALIGENKFYQYFLLNWSYLSNIHVRNIRVGLESQVPPFSTIQTDHFIRDRIFKLPPAALTTKRQMATLAHTLLLDFRGGFRLRGEIAMSINPGSAISIQYSSADIKAMWRN
jgi:hypothetical protein